MTKRILYRKQDYKAPDMSDMDTPEYQAHADAIDKALQAVFSIKRAVNAMQKDIYTLGEAGQALSDEHPEIQSVLKAFYDLRKALSTAADYLQE